MVLLPKSTPLPPGWVWLPLIVDENNYRIMWARLIGGDPCFPMIYQGR